jgi:hypothetical protein
VTEDIQALAGKRKDRVRAWREEAQEPNGPKPLREKPGPKPKARASVEDESQVKKSGVEATYAEAPQSVNDPISLETALKYLIAIRREA